MLARYDKVRRPAFYSRKRGIEVSVAEVVIAESVSLAFAGRPRFLTFGASLEYFFAELAIGERLLDIHLRLSTIERYPSGPISLVQINQITRGLSNCLDVDVFEGPINPNLFVGDILMFRVTPPPHWSVCWERAPSVSDIYLGSVRFRRRAFRWPWYLSKMCHRWKCRLYADRFQNLPVSAD